MAISFTRYINITSGVIGASTTAQRELLARLYTTNELVPTNQVVQFSDLADVADYFGTTSEEYLRAVFYFSYVSPNITSPQSIAFARWANVDTGAQIFGVDNPSTIAQLQAITAGGFTLTVAGTDVVVTALDLSSASTFSDVATAIQNALRTAGSANISSSTVVYNAVAGRFEFDSGNTGAETIEATDGAQNVLAAIGWTDQAAFSDGVDAQTVTDALTRTTEDNNNFGSFLFMPTLTEDQYVEAATWNAAQNVMFQFMVPVTRATASALSAALVSIRGVGMTLVDPTLNEYPEMVPMMVLAATNYANRNAVQSYQFRQVAGLTPTVTTTADARTFDALRVNYYGRTQTAGRFIDFYQRGFLGGTATDPVNMNTYANEQWLKDRAGSQYMNLLTSSSRVPGNATGRGQVLSVLQGVIEEALNNGTISAGRTLSSVQRIAVAQLSGVPLAYIDIENKGYWKDAVVRDVVNPDNGLTETQIDYTLIYAKDNVVRRVTGRHALV